MEKEANNSRKAYTEKVEEATSKAAITKEKESSSTPHPTELPFNDTPSSRHTAAAAAGGSRKRKHKRRKSNRKTRKR